MLWDILPRWTLYSLAFFPMKKILFLHGFASSGHSGTVMTLRQLLYADGVSVIAPDLPVMPQEALALIAQLIEDERATARHSACAHQSGLVDVAPIDLWWHGTSRVLQQACRRG